MRPASDFIYIQLSNSRNVVCTYHFHTSVLSFLLGFTHYIIHKNLPFSRKNKFCTFLLIIHNMVCYDKRK